MGRQNIFWPHAQHNYVCKTKCNYLKFELKNSPQIPVNISSEIKVSSTRYSCTICPSTRQKSFLIFILLRVFLLVWTFMLQNMILRQIQRFLFNIFYITVSFILLVYNINTLECTMSDTRRFMNGFSLVV